MEHFDLERFAFKLSHKAAVVFHAMIIVGVGAALVEQADEFAHDYVEADEAVPAPVLEALVETAEDGVVDKGAKGGHAGHVADGLACAAHVTWNSYASR